MKELLQSEIGWRHATLLCVALCVVVALTPQAFGSGTKYLTVTAACGTSGTGTHVPYAATWAVGDIYKDGSECYEVTGCEILLTQPTGYVGTATPSSCVECGSCYCNDNCGYYASARVSYNETRTLTGLGEVYSESYTVVANEDESSASSALMDSSNCGHSKWMLVKYVSLLDGTPYPDSENYISYRWYRLRFNCAIQIWERQSGTWYTTKAEALLDGPGAGGTWFSMGRSSPTYECDGFTDHYTGDLGPYVEDIQVTVTVTGTYDPPDQ